MENLIEKISSYHIFNYMIPGMVFLIMCDMLCNINLYDDKFINMLVMAYFGGIIISRISSLITEKVVYKIWRLKKESYKDYIEASKKDGKISVLMEDNNMYRNLCTTMFLLLLFKILQLLNVNKINSNLAIIIILALLTLLFAFSYVKQSKYIISRIKNSKN